MATAMSPHLCFPIFLFVISAVAAIDDCIRNPRDPKAKFPVDFKCTLDVSERMTETSYQKFITNLRTELAKRGGKSGSIPILPSDDPTHLFDVDLLTTKNGKVTVRVLNNDLYVRGYLMQTPNQWMEFSKEDGIKMVDKASKPLDFGNSYKAMEAAAGSNVMVTNIIYNQLVLENAVKTLASFENTPNGRRERGKSLIVMAQMISEAARFIQISAHFASKIATKTGVQVPVWMFEKLVQDWSTLSRPAQCYDAYKNEKVKYKYTPVTIYKTTYTTVETLRDSIFGVMKKENTTEKKCGIKKLADENEGEAAVVLSADM